MLDEIAMIPGCQRWIPFIFVVALCFHAFMTGIIRKVKGFSHRDPYDLSAFIIGGTPLFETVYYDTNGMILLHFNFKL